jgi:proteic killer suppression protein
MFRYIGFMWRGGESRGEPRPTAGRHSYSYCDIPQSRIDYSCDPLIQGRSDGAPAGGRDVPRFRAIERQARRKLLLLDNAGALNDLRQPPGNRLEALKGDRQGQHSIRINDQWRICFVWRDGGAEQVEIVDYH